MPEDIHIAELRYNNLETDFRVEVVVANLMKYQRVNSDFFIKRIGTNDRPNGKDIKSIYTHHYGLDGEAIILESYRESIYDYLPEGFFHPPSLGNYNSHNIESVVNEIRKQKEVEENARKFFQPFEVEIFKTEIAALLKETEFDVADSSDTLLNILSELWPLLVEVDKDVARIFFFILPFLHKVRGKKEWIEKFLSAFLETKVEISFVPNVINHSDDEEGFTTLGKARLGISFIPNAEHSDGERNWQINIGPIPDSKIEKYVSGHPFRELLHRFYDYLLPVSVKFFENFITVKTQESFCISSHNKYSSRLGYTTFI